METGSEARGNAAQKPSLPTGTVTFLFSDIEGSTARWEAHQEAMVDGLHRHDAIMRGAISTHRGRVFKTIGDAFCAAFATAPDAIAAAVAAQQGFLHADWRSVGGLRVRMAIHSGSADERDGDYFGPAVNRAARLLEIAHGGQTLVSGVSAELSGGALSAGVNLRDLGEHTLRDVERRERVYQLSAPDLVDEFPPLLSAGAFPNNLPHQLTSLFGREAEIADIKRLLQDSRLVTLVGTGGIGKTRCALQVGAEVLHDYGQGVWFVELAPVADPQFVASAIASAIRIHESHDRPLPDAIVDFLKNRRLLLILDNCEHVVEQTATVADSILRMCDRVSILSTSRESLGLPGERVYHVPPLSVPPAKADLTADEAMRYGAISLFVARARLADDAFRLTDDIAPIVAQICRRLDGIALAIELAAARVKILGVRELDDRLDERFRILTGGSRTSLHRQQTMRALIDWSYNLLSEQEKTVFRHLAVFANGFTIDAAGAVCSDETNDEFEILDLVSALVDKSLVAVEPDLGGYRRYRLLESLREYGREKLIEHGEYENACRRFGVWCYEFVRSAEGSWGKSPSRAWEATVGPELENLRFALSWSLEDRHDVRLGQRIAAASRRIWGRFAEAEGLRWVHAASSTAKSPLPREIEAALWLAEAQAHVGLRRYRAALDYAERAQEAYASIGDELLRSEARGFAGFSLVMIGESSRGMPMLADSLAAYREFGALQLIGHALEELAIAHAYAREFDAARDRFREALANFKSVENERGIANVAGNLAEVEFRAGHLEAALQLASEAIAGDPTDRDACTYLSNLAAYLVAGGQWQDARMRASESLNRSVAHRAEVDIVFALQHLAAVAALRNRQGAAEEDAARAAGLLGYVDEHLAVVGGSREQTELQEYERMASALKEALGDAEYERLSEEGRHWPEERAIAEARRI
jgi:predicted ATPase/class 3 adenylate cyclase